MLIRALRTFCDPLRRVRQTAGLWSAPFRPWFPGRSYPTPAAVTSVGLVGPLLCLAGAAIAADAGPTLPIAAFTAERSPHEARDRPMLTDAAITYPVATRGFTAGAPRLGARLSPAYAAWLTGNLAIVADEPSSRRWLAQHDEALAAMQATVLVVRVRDGARMNELRRLHAALPMAPADLSHLAPVLARVGAAVYPLLVMPDGTLMQSPESTAAPPRQHLRPH